jgi:hypothetical protein
LLPPRASDMLAVRNRAIDGTGLSPARFAALPAATRTFTSKLSFILGTIGIGGVSRLLPPTPPYERVRIRRFAGLSADGLFCVCARGSDSRRPRAGFGPSSSAVRASPFPAAPKASDLDFLPHGQLEISTSSVFPAFRPSAKLVPPTTPSADFSAAVTSLATRSVRSPGHDGDLPR